MCFIIAFCAFILAWGAFDAAFVFYPPDLTANSLRHQSHDLRPGQPSTVHPDGQAKDSTRENTQKS